ncbi:MAG TPA: class I SAM-dependent rRNA methyltransferase [Firmicutes bacterium]|nr:class I SAM-dependent rRNA methyltransferase [Candidatus Fermentithermobacillaceae bacterium]
MRPVVRLLPRVTHRVFSGHPWIFSSEIGAVEGAFSPGDIVEVRDPKGRFVCLGYINPESTITVRVLSREDRDIDEGFFKERVRRAVEYRHLLFGVKGSFGDEPGGYRLVFSEGDFLPGLVVDIFAGYVSFQTLTLGIDRWKETILDAIREYVNPKGIYERNDAPVRALEGMPLRAGYVGEPFDPLIEMDENGVTVLVDIQRGQKTGYFLDQSDNRLVVRKYLTGKTVLDAFSYSGGFGLSALVGGALNVHFLDASEAALDLAKAACDRNGFAEKASFECGNVFDVLRDYERKGLRFGAVLLDPPAFARSRKMVESALSGYKEINLRAMKVVKDGGILCTSSCSQHITPQEFDSMLEDAAKDARVTLRLIERRGQRSDHPILSGVPETEYLKFRMFQVLKA